MRFEAKIKTLSVKYPLRVTSWGRDQDGNALVGGVPNSLHRLWLAMDVVLWNTWQKIEFIEDARKMGLWCLDEGDHIHVQEVLS